MLPETHFDCSKLRPSVQLRGAPRAGRTELGNPALLGIRGILVDYERALFIDTARSSVHAGEARSRLLQARFRIVGERSFSYHYAIIAKP